MSFVGVGIVGFGTVGTGTYEILIRNRDILRDRVGAELRVLRIADLDIASDRGVDVDPGLLTTDAREVLNHPDVEVVVELIGGTTTACDLILEAIRRGKHVVTANKALLAERGPEIYEEARRHQVSIQFEASVGGGIPIIGALAGGLAANRISGIMGILNGTSNYILTRMTREGLPYDRVVDEAVALGFAEDPPTLDVDGTDAAHKLTILLSLSLGTPVRFSSVYREGITAITPDDIRFAGEFGYAVKLLAIGRKVGEGFEARVHPAMIPKGHILASVEEAFNAIYLVGDAVGPNLYYGLGAGKYPTGSAVVSDIMDLARRLRHGTGTYRPPLGSYREESPTFLAAPMEDHTGPYYFRFSAVDQPGVLSKIAGILGAHRISIASVIQKGREINGPVPIVMLTHEAREADVRKAIESINRLDVVTDPTIVVRVEDGTLHG